MSAQQTTPNEPNELTVTVARCRRLLWLARPATCCTAAPGEPRTLVCEWSRTQRGRTSELNRSFARMPANKVSSPRDAVCKIELNLCPLSVARSSLHLACHRRWIWRCWCQRDAHRAPSDSQRATRDQQCQRANTNAQADSTSAPAAQPASRQVPSGASHSQPQPDQTRAAK